MFRVFWIGLSVSFLGSLPLGTLNVAAMQLGMTEGIWPAMLFSSGALTGEMIYVRASLVAMDWVRKKERLFRILEWATILLVLALAAGSIRAAMAGPGEAKNILLSNTIHRFWLGFIMRALNPVLIPFWFGWSTTLYARGLLQPREAHYNIFIVGIGIGTFGAHCIFIMGGKMAADTLRAQQSMLNWVIATVFAITAVAQIVRLRSKS